MYVMSYSVSVSLCKSGQLSLAFDFVADFVPLGCY